MATAVNYEDAWWARVYDSFYWATRQEEHDFYVQQAKSLAPPVLEVACGTGTVLLELLRLGVNAYGFDISQQMLGMLQRKVPDGQRGEILRRVRRQNMVDFRYPSLRFGTVLIPSGSFLFLLTQEEQINCLTNIYRHLCPGGALVMNLTVPSYEQLTNMVKEPQLFTDFGDFKDGISGSEIHVSRRNRIELEKQLWNSDWRFSTGAEHHTTSMCFRWIFPEEFKLLLRLAGFLSWDVAGGFDRRPVTAGGETVWSAVKPTSCQISPHGDCDLTPP